MKIHVNFLFMLVLLVILAPLATSCSDKEFEDFSQSFYSTYREIGGLIDTKDVLATLKSLKSEQVGDLVNKLKVDLESIDKNIPPGKQEQYEELLKWYQGVIYLTESYDKWNNYGIDERRKVCNEMDLIIIRIRNLESN